jgi:hypothetical protein
MASVTPDLVHESVFYVVQEPKSYLGRLIVEVSRPPTIIHTRAHARTHTRTVRLLWTSDQLVAEAATYTTRNKHKRHISTPSTDSNLCFQQPTGGLEIRGCIGGIDRGFTLVYSVQVGYGAQLVSCSRD